MGVKKSTVATRARSGAMRYTAASSREPVPINTLLSTIGGRAPSTCPSSTGLSLQAQPAPWLYSVNRSGESCSIGAKYRYCLRYARIRPGRCAAGPPSPASGEGKLADRGQLQPSLHRCFERRVLRQVWVLLHYPLRLGADLAQQLGLQQRVHRHIGHPMLARSHQLAHAAQPHVLFGELEAIIGTREELEPRKDLRRGIVGQQEAPAGRGTSSDPTPELMQLRQPEAIGAFDHHGRRVGDVHADFDDGGRDQDVDLAGDEALHDLVLFLQATVDEA